MGIVLTSCDFFRTVIFGSLPDSGVSPESELWFVCPLLVVSVDLVLSRLWVDFWQCSGLLKRGRESVWCACGVVSRVI